MKFSKNNILFKIASFNSLSVVIRLVTGLLLSKAMAYFVLPQGLALTGNLRSFLISCQGISANMSQNGVIKYIAENPSDTKSQDKIISTAFFFVLFFTSVVSIFLLIFSKALNQLVFGTYDYTYLFKIIAFTLPFFTFNIFILAIVNGIGKYKVIVKVNSIGYIINLVLVVVLMYFYDLEGALFAIVSVPLFLFLVTVFCVRDIKYILKKITISGFSKYYFKGLSSFAIMALFSALTIPIMHIIIKNHVIQNIGQESAGYWEGMIRISQYYMIFVTSLFTLYLLPKLSENKTKDGFRNLIIEFYKMILPVVIVGFVLIYFFRYWVIRVAFTKEFLPIQDLFIWQLIGDFFKIVAFVIAYQMQAKKMLAWYIVGEIFYVIITYFFSIYCIEIFELKGVVIGHAIGYMCYFLLLLFIFRKSFFINKKKIEV